MGFRRLATGGTVLATAIAIAVALPAEADDAVVLTDKGRVRGTVATDHRTFQGIPYAAPPVGQLRWKSPGAAAPWNGVRDVTRPGNDCPQKSGFLGDELSENEDCLYLNLTTPRRTNQRLLPVMVFVHGGGFYSGSGALYGAEKLVTGGDVVVVTPNYRLGVFGFLDHPSLGGAAGNFGLEDQQAALRWVRRNAMAFGGDPNNVTLVGESAGSVSTCSHLAAPSSAGLFRRAIMQSGPCSVADEWPYHPEGNWFPRSRDVAEREGEAAAGLLQCTDPVSVEACLRGKTAKELLTVANGGEGFGPVYGGNGLLPISPKQALATGRFNKVPVMHGTTKHEHRLFVGVFELIVGTVATEASYQAEVRHFLGDEKGNAALARYPVGDYGSASEALAAVWTDRAWSCTALTTDRSLSNHVPTYAFEFADETAPWASELAVPSFPVGAFHAADLQYLFNDEQFPGPTTTGQRKLSDQMVRYWTRFAHTGNPNGGDAPLWPRFRDGTERVQSLAPGKHGIRQVDIGRDHKCGFWLSL